MKFLSNTLERTHFFFLKTDFLKIFKIWNGIFSLDYKTETLDVFFPIPLDSAKKVLFSDAIVSASSKDTIVPLQSNMPRIDKILLLECGQ